MITIKEMADILGISTTTVSNVINGKRGEVSEKTVKKVMETVEKYEYVPNMTARNLASQKSRIIGLGIINYGEDDNCMKDAFISELVGSIELELQKRGYFLMCYFTPSINELINTLLAWNVDGLILFGVNKAESKILNEKYKKPKVFIDSYVNIKDSINSYISLEDRKGGYIMTKYILEKGHKKIAFIAENMVGNNRERLEGFKQALSEKNIEFTNDDHIEIRKKTDKKDAWLEQAYEKVKDYTAFFCASDYHALLLINYLRDKGLKIPKDISVAGFDGNIYSKLSRPVITTIQQNPSDKGKKAVECLINKLKKTNKSSERILLSVELLEGETIIQI